LDDTDATAHYTLCGIFRLSGDLEGCRAEAERALSLDPNHTWALGLLGAHHTCSGQLSQALAALNNAMRTSPHDDVDFHVVGHVRTVLQERMKLLFIRPNG